MPMGPKMQSWALVTDPMTSLSNCIDSGKGTVAERWWQRGVIACFSSVGRMEAGLRFSPDLPGRPWLEDVDDRSCHVLSCTAHLWLRTRSPTNWDATINWTKLV